MRVVHVLITERDTGLVSDMTSFGVFEEQLVDEVVAKAEKNFVETCVAGGVDEVDAEESIDDGYCETNNNIISIVWSDI